MSDSTNSSEDSGGGPTPQGDSADKAGDSDSPGPNASLEQWKFYSRSSLDVSKRRQKTNRFYQKVVLGTFAGVGAGLKLGVVSSVILFTVGLVGIVFSILWIAHILSFKRLNEGKYEVMEAIAKDGGLPFAPFNREWDILDEGDNPKKYIPHTIVEIWWPRVTLAVFGGIAIAGCLTWQSKGDWLSLAIVVWIVLTAVYWGLALRGKWTPFDSIAPHWKQWKKYKDQ